MSIYFMPIWNILQTFAIFYSHLLHFVFIWYIFPVLVSCNKKNLATLMGGTAVFMYTIELDPQKNLEVKYRSKEFGGKIRTYRNHDIFHKMLISIFFSQITNEMEILKMHTLSSSQANQKRMFSSLYSPRRNVRNTLRPTVMQGCQMVYLQINLGKFWRVL
jgi:hypothetical protein